jgi:hypothetical protein
MLRQLGVVLAIVALSGGCRATDRDRAATGNRDGSDTIVTAETVKDTTIVTADTSIDVDTVKQTDNIEDKKD